MNTCKNCGHTVEGNYCSHCRQDVHTGRLTWKEIARQIRNATVDVDRGFFFTAREMFVRPGVTLRNYLEGKRVNYSNPFFFVLLTAGFASLLFMTFDVSLPVQSINLERIERVNPLVAQKYFVLVGIFFVTMLSVSDGLLYRKSTLNAAELLVVNAFQAGQVLVITLLFFPVLLVQDRLIDPGDITAGVRTLLKAITFGYLVWTRWQLFSPSGPAWQRALSVAQIVALVFLYEYVLAGFIMRTFFE
jgi:hypothetical protein